METQGKVNSSNTRVSAIVLNYENFSETIGCVRKLLEQDYALLHCIVVDNASPNDSLTRLRDALGAEKRVTILAAPSNGGYASGNNVGARWAITHQQPAYILIINPDIRMTDASAITQLVAFAESRPDAGAVGPRVVLAGGALQGPHSRPNLALSCVKFLIPVVWFVLRRCHQNKIRTLTTPQRCFWTTGACMLLRAASFEKVGMLDEGLFLESEEPALAERLNDEHQFFYYFPGVNVVHRRARQGKSEWTTTSLKYYYKTYRGAGGFALRVLDFCSRFYHSFYLPIWLRLQSIH